MNLGESTPTVTSESSSVFGASNAGISSLPKSLHPEHSGVSSEEEGRAPLDWSIFMTDADREEARLYLQVMGYTRRFGVLSTVPSSEIVMRRYWGACFMPFEMGGITAVYTV